MSYETIGDWITSAKSGALAAPKTPNIKVIKRVPKSKGNIIMEVAEKLLPWLMQVFDGARDENGMLVQRSRIRAIALNAAQGIIAEQDKKHSANA